MNQSSGAHYFNNQADKSTRKPPITPPDHAVDAIIEVVDAMAVLTCEEGWPDCGPIESQRETLTSFVIDPLKGARATARRNGEISRLQQRADYDLLQIITSRPLSENRVVVKFLEGARGSALDFTRTSTALLPEIKKLDANVQGYRATLVDYFNYVRLITEPGSATYFPALVQRKSVTPHRVFRELIDAAIDIAPDGQRSFIRPPDGMPEALIGDWEIGQVEARTHIYTADQFLLERSNEHTRLSKRHLAEAVFADVNEVCEAIGPFVDYAVSQAKFCKDMREIATKVARADRLAAPTIDLSRGATDLWRLFLEEPEGIALREVFGIAQVPNDDAALAAALRPVLQSAGLLPGAADRAAPAFA